jgi:hypothetical protein
MYVYVYVYICMYVCICVCVCVCVYIYIYIHVRHCPGMLMILGVSFACIIGLFCLYSRSLLTLVHSSALPRALTLRHWPVY